ncbi:MAG: hypothetical protein JXQ73_25165 [Phycisphaerae bacterium]|nr:hypothetical protein [Phycisphaerae bacterium]
MTTALQTPWFWLLVVYFLLELVSLISFKRSWLAFICGELLQILTHTFSEITTRKGKDRFCGVIVTIVVLCMVMAVIHSGLLALHGNEASDEIRECTGLVVLLIPVAFLSFFVNLYGVVQRK